MVKREEILKNDIINKDIGYLMWHLEEIENFYPCYKAMLSKEKK